MVVMDSQKLKLLVLWPPRINAIGQKYARVKNRLTVPVLSHSKDSALGSIFTFLD